ncbi:hypothetical protein CMV_015483 [Castanea mollissima]|uniref:Uncharacterized protein n=1 Tax=Castanea mollissima TaxID=60419 RepID=A0A8J4R931_9ROSI|nr:hypothetical protein CMV_015483 [Castanea mollissima]
MSGGCWVDWSERVVVLGCAWWLLGRLCCGESSRGVKRHTISTNQIPKRKKSSPTLSVDVACFIMLLIILGSGNTSNA